ncbi:MAG: cytochrome P450 [Acidimicrobiia bacterium]|nr:cytochrome P450 [Acidimicrobiia bacterium]RZV48080.1 MAG: cytochrome P450 [Acidimicrobiales bacterium]
MSAASSSVSLAELEDDPHPFYDRARSDGDLVWVDALGGWLTLSHAVATDILRNDDLFTVDDPRFSTARVIGSSMLSTDGAIHRTHRSPFAELFTRSQVADNLGEWANQLAASRVADLRARATSELRTELFGPFATEVIVRALGLSAPASTVLSLYRTIAAEVGALRAEDEVSNQARIAFEELRAIILASATAPHSLDGPGKVLDADALVSNAAVVLFGAIETTEGAVANAVHHLAMAGLDAIPEGDELSSFIEESFRLEPAAAVVHRYCTRPTVIAGTPIDVGDFVIVSLSAANRDPAVFDDPHHFDPRRPDNRKHLTFATGPHVCFGAHLARLEVTSMLDALRPDVPVASLTSTSPKGLVFRKPAEVNVSWTDG